MESNPAVPGGSLTSKPTWSNTFGCSATSAFFVLVGPLLEGTTDMRNNTQLTTEAGRQYAAAYDAHYTKRDLPVALQLYMKVMASHPGAQEAGYSRMQVQNIVNAVVPKQELLDAQIELARAHFEHEGAPDTARIPVRPLASALST
jgi:hypothetical protein